MKRNENKVNRYAACCKCANNGCKFCPKCDGSYYFKISLSRDPIVSPSKEVREYQKRYYQKHKEEIYQKRKKYFLEYYHRVMKNNPDAMERRRARGLKYYYDHHDEIRAKRNAKKRADWKDPAKVETLRAEHKQYMRDYRAKKKESK